MTLCNMSIEAGARAGMIAPDETTFAYLAGPADCSARARLGTKLSRTGSTLHTDPGAHYDRIVEIDASSFAPYVTWGTNPGMVVPVTGEVPDPTFASSDADRRAAERALEYMALYAGHADRRHHGRSRLYRLVHQLAHRRSARRRQSDQGLSRRLAACRPWSFPARKDQAAGRKRRTGPDLHSRPVSSGAKPGCSMCLAHESRHPATGRALRLHQQPQF